MAIKIHHGPNGSYKTSGAIQDDLVPALKDGRYIITNIRGLTRERVFKVFPETPSTLEIVNLDIENVDDLERMRTWFLWAPRGAFIIFDETQLIFLKSWRESDLKRFDYPGGPEQAKADGRPMNWLDAWTRHRHFNWDVILTTPNISYIRDDIRMTVEKAYLHSNLAVIGIRGRYKESQHSAQDNKPPAQGVIVEIKKIKQETFALYESTATGSVSDTIAGKSFFKQPKVLLFMAIPALCVGSVIYDGGPSILMDKPVPPAVSAPVVSSSPAVPVVPQGSARPAPGSRSDDVSTRQAADIAGLEHPFAGREFIVRGALIHAKGTRYIFGVRSSDGRELRQTDMQLISSGYRIYPRGECAALIAYDNFVTFATCIGDAGRGAERLASERSDEASIAVSSQVASAAVVARELDSVEARYVGPAWDFSPR